MRRKVEGLTLLDMCMEVRGLAESFTSLHRMGSRDQIQLISLDDKHL